MINDGMDQNTTPFSNEIRKSKAGAALVKLRTHLVGSLVHSGQAPHGKEIYGSFDVYQWPHDPNLHVTVLLEVLHRWSKEHKITPVLYLQMDNCVRENKNQTMFAALAVFL